MPGNVAARMRQSCDEPFANGIATEGHNDWYRTGCLLNRSHRGRRRRDNQVDFEPHELRGEIEKSVEFAIRVPEYDHNVLPFEVSDVSESLAQCLAMDHLTRGG